MSFNSLEYILFVPIVFSLYWILSKKTVTRNLLIVFASCVFYSCWDIRFLFLMLLTATSSYYSGILMQRYTDKTTRKAACWGNLILNIGILATFKYFNFFGESFAAVLNSLGFAANWTTLNIVLPVGISFYTFQAIGYSFDVYRKTTQPTDDAVSFFAFITFFPQLVAGPIERASSIIPQFQRKIKFDESLAYDGMRQILWGFFKKMVIADNCAIVVNNLWDNCPHISGYTVLLSAIFFTFQIYGDFSGYSDIAIGTGKLFGIKLRQNFNNPFFSSNIAEFWRKWHISLMEWFKDYVYIPLGGSRVSKTVTVRNIAIVFALSGLWHGANWTFVAWGAFNAILVIIYSMLISKIPLKLPRILSIAVTFAFIATGFIFFRSNDIAQACEHITALFGNFNYFYINKEHYFVYIAFMLIIEWIHRHKEHSLQLSNHGIFRYKIFRLALYLALTMSLIICSGTSETFIYFQF